MLSRPALLRQLPCHRHSTPLLLNGRYLNTAQNAKKAGTTSLKNSDATQKTNTGSNATPVSSANRPKSWLTQKVETSPIVRYWFNAITTVLGYNSPKQIAGRRSFLLYEQVCAVAPDAGKDFWQNECDLPPTFQSWFTVTNLHIWMLSVRLRALPPPHGKYYVQFLIDHFFLDIEDRIRAILQPSIPPTPPYTFTSHFYINPNVPKDGKLKRGSRAPERLVTRQMKIFKEQWMGMGMSFDLGLARDDMEMAAAVWRNLLGARGAQGIAYPDSGSSATKFRRSVNLVGGAVENPEKVDFAKEETRDDGSGVHDYSPEEADKYLHYPELMVDIVSYIRRELARLEAISDEEIMQGSPEILKFGEIGGKK
ncbi:Serine carboxypeptidase 3 [Stygiomarasmius scandens]|uniref:Serine carboxypeptidase 3 n=1 Tax=Marasmiellus scandens TaxID=2682957 RepID=A0ABR1JK64_9AGAR